MKKSYGLQVAKLAGIHRDIIWEAEWMLKKLESLHHSSSTSPQLSIASIPNHFQSDMRFLKIK